MDLYEIDNVLATRDLGRSLAEIKTFYLMSARRHHLPKGPFKILQEINIGHERVLLITNESLQHSQI